MDCFVCLQPGTDGDYLWKYCQCEHYCHLRCFKTMVRTVPSHFTKCHICNTPYNMKSSTYLSIKLHGALLTFDVSILLLISTGSYLIIESGWSPIVLIVCSCALLIFWVTLLKLHVLHRTYRGAFFPISVCVKRKCKVAQPTGVYTEQTHRGIEMSNSGAIQFV